MIPRTHSPDPSLGGGSSVGQRILDVGCGRKKASGAIGLDRYPLEGVDVIHDLERFPYPFEDNYFDVIHAHHVIEHVMDTTGFMSELFRIARAGCILHLSTPHYSYMGSWRDPTHLHHFSIYTFDYFTGEHPADYYAGYSKWVTLRSEIRMLRLWRLAGIEWLINLSSQHPRGRWFRKSWEEYACFLLRAREIRVILQAGKQEGIRMER